MEQAEFKTGTEYYKFVNIFVKERLIKTNLPLEKQDNQDRKHESEKNDLMPYSFGCQETVT